MPLEASDPPLVCGDCVLTVCLGGVTKSDEESFLRSALATLGETDEGLGAGEVAGLADEGDVAGCFTAKPDSCNILLAFCLASAKIWSACLWASFKMFSARASKRNTYTFNYSRPQIVLTTPWLVLLVVSFTSPLGFLLVEKL